MGKIVLIRHGQSMGNVHKPSYLNDSTNFLSLKGIDQAYQCGRTLNQHGFKFKYAFSSALTRAKLTANIVLQTIGQTGHRVVAAEELNEREHLVNPEQVGEPIHLETLDEVAERVLPYFGNPVRRLAEDGNVLVTCHYWVTNVILHRLFPERWPSMNEYVVHATPYVIDRDGFFMLSPPESRDDLEVPLDVG